MRRVRDNKPAFYVVQFIDLPFESIDEYVCVPYTWMILSNAMNDKVFIAYPKDDDPFNTRDRVKRKERYDDEWRFYMATVKHKTDSYNDAQSWIATKNDYGPLVKEGSRVTDKQPKLLVNKELCSAYQPKRSYSSKMERNLAIDAQTPSNSIDNTRHFSTRSVRQPIAVSQNKSQNDSRALRTHTENSRDFTTSPQNIIASETGDRKNTEIPIRSVYQPSRIQHTTVHENGYQNLCMQDQLVKLSTQMNSKPKRVNHMDDGTRSSVTGSHLNVIANASQKDEYIVKESRSPYHVVPSDSYAIRDHEEVSDCDRSADESPVERTDNVYGTANDPRHDSADRPTADQNSTSTNHQTHSRFILEQQMLRNFGSLFKEMGYTLRHKANMCNTLWSSIFDIAMTYKKLLGFVEQFKTAANDPRHDSADRPTADQNSTSTNHQTHSRFILEQQMLDNFAILFTGMDSTLRHTTDMYNTLRSSILDIAKTYKKLLGSVEQFNTAANDPRHDFAVRPTADQNSTSTNHQTHSRFILEQQMLDYFAILFIGMGSTLRHTTDMYHTLRSSILDITETYRKFLDSVEQFNTAAGNTASSASPSSNLTREGSRSPEETHTEVTASASSSYQDQHRIDVANKTLIKKNEKLYRVVLPPEYDADDTRWTLKNQKKLPRLVELMPQSGVYVSPRNLNNCQQVSKDCKSLARRLLPEVFSRNALSVCLSLTETWLASNNEYLLCRPELDKHACSVLLNFVFEYGIRCGWNTDLQPILRALHSEIQKIRFKYGVMVEC